jgi:hypothetical protein
MAVRFHTDKDNSVLCVRFLGMITGPDGLKMLRAHHQANPAGINFKQIFDVRTWAGSLADDDLVEHFRWFRTFRQQHDQEITTLPINVYLVRQNLGTAAIVKQLGDIRGQPIQWAHSVVDAWEYCVPTKPLPQSVAKFFSAW